MGNESSQMEKPAASQLPAPQDDGGSEDDGSASIVESNKSSGTNKTSASRALARDLERSVMESNQYNVPQLPAQKRRKRKRAQSQVSVEEDAPDAKAVAAVVSPTQRNGAQDGIDEDGDMVSQDDAVNEHSTRRERSAARKHLVREVRRMKKTVLVNSGKAKWAPRIDGVKWEVEKLPPGEWSNRKLTDAENLILTKYKAQAKEAKQRLKEFDRDAGLVATERGAEHTELSSYNEFAASNVNVAAHIAENQATETTVTAEKPVDATQQPTFTETSSSKERKRQKKVQRKSSLTQEVEVQTEENQQDDPPQSHPEMVSAKSDTLRKKRKHNQAQIMAFSPPQHSAAAEKRPVPQSVAGKRKTGLVKTWLSSQGPQDDMEEISEHVDAELSDRPQKRKRVLQYQPDDNEDLKAASQNENDHQTSDSAGDLPTHKPAMVDPGRSKVSKSKGQAKQQPQSDYMGVVSTQPPLAMSTGPFTVDEKAVADLVFGQVLRSEGIDDATLKHKICTWRSAGVFKDEIETALPARSKVSIRKFCQRRYHMQERGYWTTEQDEDLRNAQANYPDQWKKLQDLVGRTAADCKDRWTMHLQHSKKTGPWSQDEEAKLIAAVEHALETIKNDSTTSPELAADREGLENAVSWKVIAKDIGNTRNHRQCREKWANLKRRENKLSLTSNGETPGQANKLGEETSRKINAAVKKVRTFEIGDFYDIFVEIHTSFSDTSQRFHDEEHVLWSIIAHKNMASRFSLGSNGAALRRAALDHALKEWKIDSKKVRRRLEHSETLPAKAKVLAKLLEKSYAGRLHSMSRTFKPEMIGKSDDEILNIKADQKKSRLQRMKMKARSAARAKVQSKEFVNDVDDEEDELVGENDDVIPTTPALDDDEEDESDEDRSEEDQSVCQRRLDAQVNGRQEAGLETGPPAVVVQSRNRTAKLSNAIPRSRGETVEKDSEPTSDAKNGLAKKQPSEDESEEVHSWDNVDPENNAELLRRFDAVLNKAKLPTPLVDDSEDDEDDDDDDAEEAEVGLAKLYAVSSDGGGTPVISRENFMRTLRQ